MKFTASKDVNRLESLEELRRFTAIALTQLSQIVNNGISFADNFDSAILTVTFSAANTEQAISHGLGRVPAGYICIGSAAATTLYDGSSANTSSLLYLRATVATSARILVF